MEMFLKSVHLGREIAVQPCFFMENAEKICIGGLPAAGFRRIFAAALENTIGQKNEKISGPTSPFALQSGYLGESVQKMSNT